MAGINDLANIFHHIRVKLYPNYLPNAGEGTYIARTDSDKTVNVKDICTIMITRAGFDGSFETLYDYVCQFLDEVAYQVCDGFTTNLGYFSIHPNVGGVFHAPNESHDHKKHPITFRFGALAKLRALVKNIDVEVEGIADTHGYIMEFTDITSETVNETATPMGMFTLTGYKLKVEGDHPDVGVYFEQIGGTTKVKTGKLAENTQSKLIGVVPPCPAGYYKIVVRTQYMGGGTSFLKTPRVIESNFAVGV
jgi:hypothetical protein